MPVELISCGLANAVGSVLLAHGEGADACSPFMDAITDGLVAHDLRVHYFNFPYTVRRQRKFVLRPRTDLKCCKEHFERLLINWITSDLW